MLTRLSGNKPGRTGTSTSTSTPPVSLLPCGYWATSGMSSTQTGGPIAWSWSLPDAAGWICIRYSCRGTGSARQAALGGGHHTFPASFFTAGSIDGMPVPCVPVEAQRLFRTGYELRTVDVHDLAQLDGLPPCSWRDARDESCGHVWWPPGRLVAVEAPAGGAC